MDGVVMPRTPRISVELVCIGKIKGRQNAYLETGIAQYTERLNPYCNFSLTELPEEKESAGHTPESVKRAEGQRMINLLDQRGDYVVALSEHGSLLDSLKLAKTFAQRHPGLNTQSQGKQTFGKAHMIVLIAGPNGFSPEALSCV
jgi:23S rRNA (pseudouridine1915-N3)-methyltransferase